MRKFISALLCVIVCISICSFSASAEEVKNQLVSRSVEMLQDGDYIVKELYQTEQAILPMTEGREISGRQTSTYYSSNGTAMWALSVEGTFIYINGVSSRAISAYASVEIFANNAKLVSKNATYSGNTTTATATVSYFGSSKTGSVSISCDIHGNLY